MKKNLARALWPLALVTLVTACLARPAVAAAPRSLWAVDCLTKVLRADTPGTNAPAALVLNGARGETVSGQVVFRPERDLAGVQATVTDLRHRASNAVIPAAVVQVQWVRYLEITRNTAGVPKDELITAAPTALPDPYWETADLALKGGQAQPIWLEAQIPPQTPAGDYEGKLIVRTPEETGELPVELRVWDFEMPAERHLSVINWWRFPGLGFERSVAPDSAAYWKLLGDFCAFLHAHRQTDVNASLAELMPQKGPEAAEPGFDTSRLEHYAEVVFQAGLRRVHLHSVGRHTAGLLDPASRVQAVEDQCRRLPVLEEVIRRRGWQRRFLVSIADEPFPHHEESFAALVDRVHALAPSVRCIEAVEAEYLGALDIYVPKLSHLNLWYPRFDEVRRRGAELWFYTCCHPTGRYPNRFLDQSLLKVRVLHWINYLYQLDGYLHWGLNHFHGEDAYTEQAVSEGLPLGDRAIVYPGESGLLGSLRFSAQRDGLQDFEYLWVLEHQLARVKQRIGQEAAWLDQRQRPLELCRRVVWSFHDYTREAGLLLETRRAIAEEIEALQTEPLLVLQTSPPEGTVVPAGPRHVIVRGLANPGAKVTLNGQPVANVRPSGYFLATHFLPDTDPTIRVRVEHGGKTRTAARTFLVTD